MMMMFVVKRIKHARDNNNNKNNWKNNNQSFLYLIFVLSLWLQCHCNELLFVDSYAFVIKQYRHNSNYYYERSRSLSSNHITKQQMILRMLPNDRLTTINIGKNRYQSIVGWISSYNNNALSFTSSSTFHKTTTTGRYVTMIRSTSKQLQETIQQRNENITNNNMSDISMIMKKDNISHDNRIQNSQQQQEQLQQQLQEENTENDIIISSNYSMKPIESIAIVGGTHGNEYTGVWIVREIEELVKKVTSLKNQKVTTTDVTTTHFHTLYPSLSSTSTITNNNITMTAIIGNPMAHEHNRRFMNVDLNRQFTYQSLLTTKEKLLQNQNIDRNIEIYRANEINQLLGPKTFQPDDNNNNNNNNKDDNMDLIIDLHSTTASMDCTLIVTEGDILMIQAAAYVMYQCNQYYSSTTKTNRTKIISPNNNNLNDNNPFTTFNTNIEFETRILIDHVRACHSTRPFLPSIGKHEFTIEVGPVPQGVLRHDAILKTKIALYYLMEFISLYNKNRYNNLNDTNEIDIDKEKDTDQNDRFYDVLHNMYGTDSVPCYTDLGKIPWPSHPDNPNFPLYVVHESIQDRDFQPISKGHPLFITLDGNTINYDGSYGDNICLGFINEGGYYYSSSGSGIAAFMNATCNLYTGLIDTKL